MARAHRTLVSVPMNRSTDSTQAQNLSRKCMSLPPNGRRRRRTIGSDTANTKDHEHHPPRVDWSRARSVIEASPYRGPPRIDAPRLSDGDSNGDGDGERSRAGARAFPQARPTASRGATRHGSEYAKYTHRALELCKRGADASSVLRRAKARVVRTRWAVGAEAIA